MEIKYKRILLKLSGETLGGVNGNSYDSEACRVVAGRIRDFLALGVQVAVVVGAGNLWRGGKAGEVFDRVEADKMGMLATAMNALTIKNYCCAIGIDASVQSAIFTAGFLPGYNRDLAVSLLNEGKVVIFAGGSGNPFFTTDTAGVLRALETRCDIVIKATKVDGVYSGDPKKNPDAIRYDELTFDEALERHLKIMDSAAFSLCREHNLPIAVFDFFHGDIAAVLSGDTSVATIIHC